MQSYLRESGVLGFGVEEAFESRRSKLVPYGLLSSSFHILRGFGSCQSECSKQRSSLWLEGL
jgi:hypothetical protein